MIFDTSAYLGALSYAQPRSGMWHLPPSGITNAAELISLMDRFGINRAALGSLRSIYYDHTEGNREVLHAVNQYSSRFVGIAIVYPHYDHSLQEFEDLLVKQGMKGLQLEPLYHNFQLDDGTADPFVELSIKRQVPVFLPLCITMNWNFPRVEIKYVRELIDRYPEATYVVGMLSYEIEGVLRLMKKYDNVMAETSGLQLMQGIERLVREVGANRILYASGMPIQMAGPALAKIQEADISEEDKDLILAQNAEKLLGK
jgi:predicted TIM-barrel fold metal-dependent hydrolase